MTLCILPAPAPTSAVGTRRLLRQPEPTAGRDVIRAARAAPAATQTRCNAGISGSMPALQPRPVPSPQQSAGDSEERPNQPGGAAQAAEQHRGLPNGSPQRPRRRAGVGGGPELNQQNRGRAGGAARLAELPAGDAEQDPGRGPAKRSLDVGSPRRREATLARALLRLPAAESDYGVVLGGEQLAGPEITRCIIYHATKWLCRHQNAWLCSSPHAPECAS